MADTNRGIDLWRSIAEELNAIIKETGKKIDINNDRIWAGHLHRWSNQDWRDLLDAYARVLEEQPALALNYRKTNLQNARAYILKAKGTERVLDRKNNGGKRVAWAMINTLRETWNDINGIDLPNEDQTQPPAPLTPVARACRPKTLVETTEEYTRVTVFHNVFEYE